jgi:hypothetical protein
VNRNFGTIMQQGYIVEDVAATARQWAERLGVGPFYILDRIAMDQYYYRGVRTEVGLRLGFGYWGSIQIELIRPLSKTDTLYSRALRETPGQLNHCASVVEDLDALIASHKLQGCVIQSGQMPTGLKFAYLENYLPGGHHLELVQATDGALMAYAGMEKIAQRWDGKNPLRPMSAIGADLAALVAG